MHNEEGFREIQLNGKQLLFLFMAATVVSVVIFLMGVMVGRNVRGGGEGAEDATLAEVAPDPAPASPAAPPAMADRGTPGEAKAEPQPEPLSYAERLTRDTPPEERLKPAQPVGESSAAPAVQEPVAPPPAPPPATVKPEPAAPAAKVPPAPAKPANVAATTVGPPASDPSGPGFAVQVSISDTRREADQLASQLIAKGYPAFVVNPVKGTPKQIYRIRVGKYRNRKDAEEVLARLEKNEHFKPWIAR